MKTRAPGDPAAQARAELCAAVAARAFPAAVVEAGGRAGVRWTEAFGRLTYDADAPVCDVETIFDLASLTKVIGTASIVMRAITGTGLTLETRLADIVPAWCGTDREAVTVRQLLDHSAGLPAHAELWTRVERRDEVEAAIAAMPLDRPPGAASVYSDLGFLMLTFALERTLGGRLDDMFVPLAAQLSPTLTFTPAADQHGRIAPTEVDVSTGRARQGEVHDRNAALCEGVAGHAGLFGTAGAVGAFARLILRTFAGRTILGDRALMQEFATRSTVPGSSRGLAWDTMLPTSSCGTKLSDKAIGHTGFTGTSLWIDPERDFYVVLLTNRVHPTRRNDAVRAVRPRVHDALAVGFMDVAGSTPNS